MEQARRSRKKEQTHRTIMHSAKVLFEQYGINNVTIEQIAENADVSRSTFFSHFDSLDSLLTEIAAEEINDIFFAIEADEAEPSVAAVFRQLNSDTYAYPYLMGELFMRSILSPGESAVARVDHLLRTEIGQGNYQKMLEVFDSKDISAFIFGAYFGLIFQKFMNNEPFEDPTETNDKIQKLIKFFKNQEEQQ
ncbi:MAG: TetR/AcrR family transcriptional regulator [Clostridia bacterium]|nr:TetR/AcrR family transcriptional regulator [Clostridia bacterium]